MACVSATPPTIESLHAIKSEYGIELPPLLIEIALACPAYGGWFGSIGDDVSNQNHLININRYFRTASLPSRYVLMNHGHDGDCDAWDLEGPRNLDGEFPIVYFNYHSENCELRHLSITANTFAEYLDRFVRSHAPRCPTKSLRRRAKQLLSVHDNTNPQ